jgi:hypothetical protein
VLSRKFQLSIPLTYCLPSSLLLLLQIQVSSAISGIMYQSTRNNIPQYMKIHQQRCEKLKSRNAVKAFELVECCAESIRSLLIMFRDNLFVPPSNVKMSGVSRISISGLCQVKPIRTTYGVPQSPEAYCEECRCSCCNPLVCISWFIPHPTENHFHTKLYNWERVK